MNKLSFTKVRGSIIIKIVLNVTKILKNMFNKNQFSKNGIGFDLKKDYKNKTITIKFKEVNNE